MDYRSKLSFLEQLLGKSKYSTNTKEAEFLCCFCNHHKKKLSINLESDRWKCWVCGKNGKRLFYVIKEVGNRQDLEVYSRYHKSKQVTEKIPYYKDQGFFLKLPEEFRPIVECQNSVLGRRALNYLIEGRGLDIGDILLYKIGVMISGEQQGSVVIPSFDSRGLLNWYSIRQVGGSMKWNPFGLPKGYKNQIIPNDLNINWGEPVVLVEGPFDWLKSVRNTIPLYGNWLSKDTVLFEQIVRSEVPVFMALDPDAAYFTNKLAKNFMAHQVPVYTVDLDPFKDPGVMSKVGFKTRYENAKPLSKDNMLRERLRSIC